MNIVETLPILTPLYGDLPPETPKLESTAQEHIVLTPYECKFASFVATERRVQMMGKSAKSRRTDWNDEIEGVGAEIAFAKAMNWYYGGHVNTFELPDVGMFQVKSTTDPTNKLIVRPEDADQPCVLVIGQLPRYRIVGWIYGREGQKKEYLRNPGSLGVAWFVPHGDLHPITTIPTSLRFPPIMEEHKPTRKY